MRAIVYKGNLIEVERAKSFGKSVYVTRINGTGQWVTSTSAGVRRARQIGKAMIDKGEIRTPKKKHILYECGICACLHPWDFNGDCRQDSARFFDEQAYAEATGVSVYDVEVRSMDDRVEADGNG